MSIHNVCFEQKKENYQDVLSANFQFLEVTFSIYLNRRVFIMNFGLSFRQMGMFAFLQLGFR